ncbi:MAG: Yip1 family protein [Candidatus Micrarchaeia archaeon]
MAVKKKARPAKQEKIESGNDSLAQVEGAAMGAAGSLGIGRFKTWLYAYFHPYQACGKEKKNAKLGSTAATFALAGLVQAAVLVIVIALMLAFSLRTGISFTVTVAIVMLIAYPIACVIGGFAMSALYFIVAKLLGGKGSFTEQAYCMALVSGGVILMMAPFNVLQIIPMIGWIFSLLGLAVTLYGIVSQYRMISAVHSLSQLRAIVVLVVPLFIIMALLLVFVGVAAIAALGAYGTTLQVQ